MRHHTLNISKYTELRNNGSVQVINFRNPNTREAQINEEGAPEGYFLLKASKRIYLHTKRAINTHDAKYSPKIWHQAWYKGYESGNEGTVTLNMHQ